MSSSIPEMPFGFVVGGAKLDPALRRLLDEEAKQGQTEDDSSRLDTFDEDDEVYDIFTKKHFPKSETDAVLNCPYCFEVLCKQCQRHESEINRYRAINVTNACGVSEETIPGEPDANYIICRVCSTQVGAYCEDVYHFFHAVPSS